MQVERVADARLDRRERTRPASSSTQDTVQSNASSITRWIAARL
jgi:hypothetical protein